MLCDAQTSFSSSARAQVSYTIMVPSSEELLVRIANGDKQAFGLFYDQTAARVLGICMQVLHNRAVAEEITQEVFIEIWRTAPTFSPQKGSAASWIYRLARSRAIDKLRSRMATLSRDEKDAALQQFTHYIDVEDDAIRAVESQRLRKIVDSIGEPHRSAIMLTYFAGLSNQELADYLNIPLGTAKTRVRDGLKKLKAVLHVPSRKEGQ